MTSTRMPISPDTMYLAPCDDDIIFNHSVFAQCFLPARKLPNNQRSFEVNHGRSSLAIDAGRLLNPNNGTTALQDVPYGSAARLALDHINNHIIRSGTLNNALQVPLGNSLRRFFDMYRIPVCGTNARQIEMQIKNISAARFTFAWINEERTRAMQKNVPTIADTFEYWLEKDDRQRTFWEPYIDISPEYAKMIRKHPFPMDLRAMIGLYCSPRAMDLLKWLSYRLPTITKKKGVFVPYFGENGLIKSFGTERQNSSSDNRRSWKNGFLKLLSEVHPWYSVARITPKKSGLQLFESPPMVPAIGERATNVHSVFFEKKPKQINTVEKAVDNDN